MGPAGITLCRDDGTHALELGSGGFDTRPWNVWVGVATKQQCGRASERTGVMQVSAKWADEPAREGNQPFVFLRV
jgi:hypothetical protein